MVTIYMNLIRNGLKTIADVPKKWRAEVEKQLQESKQEATL